MPGKINRALVGGSLVLLITFNIFNILNFFFQFSMARLLSIVDYGILATLFSIIYILGLFTDSIQTVITKYSSKEQDSGKLKNIIKKSFKKAVGLSLILFLAYALISIVLSSLMKIPYFLLLANGLMIFASFSLPITRGVMQGQKKFGSMGMNMIIEGAVKLSLSIFLVVIGWKVYGAVAATVIASFIALFFSFFSLKTIFYSKEKSAETPGIYQYTPSVLFVLISITLFYSIDVIIAKILFDAETAGFYAMAATLAKIIFIGTAPISKALFSFSSEKEGKSKNLLLNATAILFSCLIPALVLFFLFPDFIIQIFAGRALPISASILFYLAIAISLISLANLILIYKLSIHKSANYKIFLIFPVIEAALLYFFSSNIFEFSIAFICAAAIFLWGTILLLNK